MKLFKTLVEHYKSTKINVNHDFITYVVNLAGFGKSSLSRQYSVFFSIGFVNLVPENNGELLERFFRSANDTEKCVRLAVTQGFNDVYLRVAENQTMVLKIIKLVSRIFKYFSLSIILLN